MHDGASRVTFLHGVTGGVDPAGSSRPVKCGIGTWMTTTLAATQCSTLGIIRVLEDGLGCRLRLDYIDHCVGTVWCFVSLLQPLALPLLPASTPQISLHGAGRPELGPSCSSSTLLSLFLPVVDKVPAL